MNRAIRMAMAGGLLVSGGLALAGPVNYVDVRTDGIHIKDGVVTVKPVNGEYAQATAVTVPYHVQMKAGCNGSNILKEGFVSYGSETYGGGILEGSDNYRVPVFTKGLKDLPYQDVLLHVPLAKLHVDPVAACRDYMNSRLAQGANRMQVLASDHTITKPGVISGLAMCGKSGKNGGDWGGDKLTTQLRIVCKAGPAPGVGGVLMPNHGPGMPGPGKVQAPAHVTHVSALATPAQYKGACPATVTISGSIVVSGPTTVKYRIHHAGTGTPVAKTLIFNAAGAKSVYKKITVNDTGSGWARIVVLSPNAVSSPQVNYHVTCAAAPTVPMGTTIQRAPTR